MLHVVSRMALEAVIQRFDLNDQVYAELRRRLTTRALGPGAKLSLHELAAELGVSRSPVHHALTRLTAEGLVTVQSRRGYFVTPVTVRLVEDAYDVRLALELLAAEKSVGRVTPPQLAELRRLMTATMPRPGSDWHKRNGELHAYQISLADNPVLVDGYGRLTVNVVMERITAGTEASWLDDVTAEHVELVEAYEAGDLRRVDRALRRHNQTGRRVAAEAISAQGGMA
jgi:DNA-binding GntR family transcriptional regulator